ncbi:MAG: hypothetical protein IPJ41_14670 [Phycisphaerales bacterium]|nr:hypothetical protein [Phycisphaerales bacterium]
MAGRGRPNINEDGLTVRQEKGVIALINETTVAAASRASGIAERTLHTWMKDPKFAKAYRRARREAFSLSIAMTQRYSAMAVNNLAKIMNDPASHNTARVTAAVALLRYGRESIELDDLAARVDQLEEEQQPGAGA